MLVKFVKVFLWTDYNYLVYIILNRLNNKKKNSEVFWTSRFFEYTFWNLPNLGFWQSIKFKCLK